MAVKIIPNSSCISRLTACSGVSPRSIPPPADGAARLRREGSLFRPEELNPHAVSGKERLVWLRESSVVLHLLHQFFHLEQVLIEGFLASRGQFVFGARYAALKKFTAHNVVGLFQLACVDTQVAVGSF